MVHAMARPGDRSHPEDHEETVTTGAAISGFSAHPAGMGGPMTVGARGTEEWEAKAARAFMEACGLEPNPDAIDQLVQVFLPCLRIMTSRPWDPNGGTWRKSGVLGILTDCRKKFERLWERGWKHGKRHDDSALDLINYLAMYMRSEPDSGWGEWGEPAHKEH